MNITETWWESRRNHGKRKGNTACKHLEDEVGPEETSFANLALVGPFLSVCFHINPERLVRLARTGEGIPYSPEDFRPHQTLNRSSR